MRTVMKVVARLSSCCVWLLAALFLLAAVNAEAQTYYVRAGATGANNGSDWNNAYSALPGSLVRGATYYVAGGNYSGRTFNDTQSGTTRITLKKATAADHGTDTGWQSGYGSAQAVFGTFTFNKGYYTIDGVSRTDWKTGYGIKIANYPNPSSASGVVVVGAGGANAAHGVTIRYCEVEGSHSRDDAQNDVGVFVFYGSNAALIQYCFIHDVGECTLKLRNTVGTTVEFSFISRNDSSPSFHAEGVASSFSQNLVIRCNIFEDIEGTAFIAFPDGSHHTMNNVHIYGNVFYYSTANASRSGNDKSQGVGEGVLTMFDCDITGDMFFLNNTMVNLNSSAWSSGSSGLFFGSGWPTTAERYYIKNNLWVNCGSGSFNNSGGSITDLQIDSNAYFSTSGSQGSNPQTGTGSPLVNWQAGNFTLVTHTSPGVNLGAPFNVDPYGTTRTFWDRGAFEFGSSGSDTNPPVISGLQANLVTDRSATIVWTTDEPANTVVEYGTTQSYGNTSSNGLFVTAHTAPLTGLAPSTLYNYRVKSKDGSGNTRTSANAQFTTLAADVTPPTVSITNPVPSQIVGGTLLLAANANDNYGVAGVRFLVDGQPVGTEILIPPFTYAWSSLVVSNGLHTVAATARDNAGNTTTSSAITIDVRNLVTGGLAAHWGFEENTGSTASDATGNGNTATLANGALWSAGRVGLSALGLDGVNDRATVADSTSLRLSGNITITLWVKHAALPANNAFMHYLEKGLDDHDQYSFGSYAINGATRLFFEFEDSGGTYRFIGQTNGLALSTGVWTQVTVVFDDSANQVRFYNNGQQVDAVTTSAALRGSLTHPLIIGQQNVSGWTYPLNGQLDDIRIYSRALSAAEIMSLYNSAGSSLPPPSNLIIVQ